MKTADVHFFHVRLLCMGLALAAVAPRATYAAKTVYRCVQNGQTVLTDQPCAEEPADPQSLTTSRPAGEKINKLAFDLPTVVGEWRGQVQFQGAQSGQQLDAAHSVVPMVLSFTADGKVSGSSSDNGCKLRGVWAPAVTPRSFPLDITLAECQYSGLNRRYSGNMITGNLDKSAQFSLLAYTAPIPGQPMSRYDVAATLRK